MDEKSARKKPGAPQVAPVTASPAATQAGPSSESAPAAGEVVSLDPARLARARTSRRPATPDVPIHLHIGRHLKSLFDDVALMVRRKRPATQSDVDRELAEPHPAE